jgi:hypothetical protein
MKSIKFIFAAFFISLFLISCTADSASDDELFLPENEVATGGDTEADIMRTRD